MDPQMNLFLMQVRGTAVDGYNTQEREAIWQVARQVEVEPTRLVTAFEMCGRDPDRTLAVINQ
jgi:hypothetical protein